MTRPIKANTVPRHDVVISSLLERTGNKKKNNTVKELHERSKSYSSTP